MRFIFTKKLFPNFIFLKKTNFEKHNKEKMSFCGNYIWKFW